MDARWPRNRLKWKCRRGLLELDLVLERFIPTLKDEDVQPLHRAARSSRQRPLGHRHRPQRRSYDRRFERNRGAPARRLEGKTHGRQDRDPEASRRQDPRLPGAAGLDRPRRGRHPQRSTASRAGSPTTRGSSRPRAAARRSPSSTATRASCSTAATRSSSSRSTATSSRCATCCSTASCRTASRRTSSSTSSPTTRWCTSSSRASTRGSAATRTRWR